MLQFLTKFKANLTKLGSCWLCKKMTEYYTTYPSITKPADLCAYYRKQNEYAPASFFIFTVGIVFAQSFRLFSFILDQTKWNVLFSVLKIWLLLNSCLIGATYYYLSLQKSVSQEFNRKNLEYQSKVRLKLKTMGIIPTLAFLVVPLFVSELGSDKEWLGYGWIVFYTLELQTCTWLPGGLAYQLCLITFFNATYCTSAYYKGHFKDHFSARVISPILLAGIFLLSYDRYKKENFTLKRTIKQQKKVYEKFLAKVNDPILIVDKDEIMFANEASKAKLGITKDNFYQKAEFIVSTHGTSLKEDIKSSLSKAQVEPPKQERYFFHNTDSLFINFEKTLNVTIVESFFISRGKTLALMLRDLTEDLMREEKRIEEKYKNMILFSLSHELRTPLNIFQVFLHATKNLAESEEYKERRNDAKGAWIYLRNKISDILDYAQILTNEFMLHKRPFSLLRFLNHLHKATTYLLGEKSNNIRLDFEIKAEVNDKFEGDKERLEQILFNFLSNATKFTEKGAISLKVFYPTETHDKITFQTTDTGCGMTSDTVRSLFNIRDSVGVGPQYKDHSQKSKGLSGFGLTVTKMICNRMGTDVAIESFLGKGSSFSITLCVDSKTGVAKSIEHMDYLVDVETNMCKAQERNISMRSNMGNLKPASLSSSTHVLRLNDKSQVAILVVDDNKLNRFVVKGMISRYGFHVEMAENGSVAINKLEVIQQGMPEATIVVLMDVDMPVMDGIEATIEIRKRGKKPRPYISALTAFAAESERANCLKAGMDNFISKPITKESMKDLFRRLYLIKE